MEHSNKVNHSQFTIEQEAQWGQAASAACRFVAIIQDNLASSEFGSYSAVYCETREEVELLLAERPKSTVASIVLGGSKPRTYEIFDLSRTYKFPIRERVWDF
jgi:hypothetical protein